MIDGPVRQRFAEGKPLCSRAALPTGHVTSVVEFDDDTQVAAMRTELMQPIDRSTVS